jgi:hypothetical protein
MNFTAITQQSILLIILLFIAFPAASNASGCKILDFSDHVDVICNGEHDNKIYLNRVPNTNNTSEKQSISSESPTNNGAQVSKRRRDIESVRSLNNKRYEPLEPVLPSPDNK